MNGESCQSSSRLCESRAWGPRVRFGSACPRSPCSALGGGAGGGGASALPGLCDLLYSICHILVPRQVLLPWDFLRRYSVFYRTIFIILERSYLSFLFKNYPVCDPRN